jgi:RimJ/RimL family protein N-acetyltransferase
MFERVTPADHDAVVQFLCSHEWPYHARRHILPADVDDPADDEVRFWIIHEEQRVGLIRLFDLDDVEDGSPLFDLRIAPAHRGVGLGRAAVRWLTGHLFATYPNLHRVEATTRHDNLAMQRVLDVCGYQLEGRLRESWPGEDGVRFDTLVYGVLRSDPWSSAGAATSAPLGR